MSNLDFLKRLNYLGDAAGGAENLVPINAESLIRQAQEDTSLSDFGDDYWKNSFYNDISNFNSLKRSLTLGRLLKKTEFLLSLKNRLLLIAKLKQSPSIKNESIKSPLIITGLPRTGTTILFALLSLDKRNRAPLGYEIFSPVKSTDNLAQSRQNIGECMLDLTMDIEPEIRQTHDNRASLPAECWMIANNVLGNSLPDFYAEKPFSAHFSQLSSDYNYSWHKLVLQTLQHQTVKMKWLLKCPSHLFHLDSLFRCYPDARVIHLHRDPTTSIPSLLNHLRCFERLYEKLNGKKSYRNAMVFMSDCLEQVIKQRENGVIPNNQITDVLFDELMKDPIAVIKSIYQQLNLDFNPDMPGKIKTYLDQRPRHKYGKHTYAETDFNLTDKDIRKQFKFYTEHYKIPLKKLLHG